MMINLHKICTSCS